MGNAVSELRYQCLSGRVRNLITAMTSFKRPVTSRVGDVSRLRPFLTALSFAGGSLFLTSLSVAQPPHPLAPEAPSLLVATVLPVAAVSTATVPTEISGATWDQIKDLKFEQRADFQQGVARLEARLELQVKELNEKRASFKGTTSTQAWDFAMKEMEESRAYFRSMAAEAAKATEETWTDRREKVGQAWERAQTAYSKVKASTTT